MKDAILTLLFFALGFIVFFIGMSLLFLLYLAVVPAGTGLIFSNPFAMALYPSLVLAMVIALVRVVRKPGRLVLTLGLLTLGMASLLCAGIPVTSGLPSPLSPEKIPFAPLKIHDLRFSEPEPGHPTRQVFWFHDVSLGQFLSRLYFWEGEETLQYAAGGQYDSLQNRILLQDHGGQIDLKGRSAEADYFSDEGPFKQVIMEIRGSYTFLADLWKTNPSQVWIWSLLVSLCWVGLFSLYGFKEWPLLRWVFVLLVARVLFWLFPFSQVQGPEILQGFLPNDWVTAFPYVFYGLIILSLWSLIPVVKPHKPGGLAHA